MKVSCSKLFATSVFAAAVVNQLGSASTPKTDVEGLSPLRSDLSTLTSQTLESLRGENKETSITLPSSFTKVATQAFEMKAEVQTSFLRPTNYPDKSDSVKEVIFSPEETDNSDSKSDLTLEKGSFVGDFERIVFEKKNLMINSNAFYGQLKVRGRDATEGYTSKIQQIEINDCCLKEDCRLGFLHHVKKISLRNIKKLPHNFFCSIALGNIEGLGDVEEFGEGCFKECGIPLAASSCLLQRKTYPSCFLAQTYWVNKNCSEITNFSVNWIIPKSCESSVEKLLRVVNWSVTLEVEQISRK